MNQPSQPWTRYLFFVRSLVLGNSTAKLVLYALASRVDQDGYCYPSVNRIAQDTNLSRRTVQRQLQQLAKIGLIERTIRCTVDNPRYHDTTIYRLVVSEQHYPRAHEAVGSVTETPTRVSVRHPNVPMNKQKNEGIIVTVNDNPPANPDDMENRRRIAEMAGEVANKLKRRR